MADGPSFMGSLTEDDINLAKEVGFDVSKYTPESALTREGYRPVEEADYETSWSDYGRALASGGAGVVSGLAGGTEYLTGGALGGDTRRYFEGISREQIEAMSPAGRSAIQSEFLPSAGETSIFDNFMSSLGLKTVAALPSVVSSIIPSGIALKALQGASLATRVGVAGAAARGTAGLQAGGGVAGQIYSTIEQMSDQELQDKAPIYAGYRSMMPEAEARRQYMNEVAGAAPAAAFLLTTALGGVEGQIAGRLAGSAATGFLSGVRRGAIAEAGQETVESGGGELLAQLALTDQNLAQMNWQKILSKGLEGGLVGGALGGGVGGITGMGAREQATAPDVVQLKGAGTGVASQPATGSEIGDPNARPVGSETQYAKPPSFTLDTFRSRLAGKGIEFPEDRLEEIQSRIDAANELPNARRGAAVRKLLNEFYAAAPAAPPAPGGTQTIAPGVQVGNGPDAAQTAALGVALPVKPIPPQVSAAVQRGPTPAPAAPVAPARPTPPIPPKVAAAMQGRGAPVDTGTNLQQPNADLLAEQKELISGQRAVQMFPTNTTPLPLPKGMKKSKTSRGIFHYKPNATLPDGRKVTDGLIQQLSAAGRENELLGLGDRTKQEVAAAAPGEGGVTTVSETTPEGARVRSVAATAADAERQAQMLQETSAPDNRVTIETPPVALAPRVLYDITPEGEAAYAAAEKALFARANADEAARLAKAEKDEKAEAVEGKVGSEGTLRKLSKDALKVMKEVEAIAADAFRTFSPKAKEDIFFAGADPDKLSDQEIAEAKASMVARLKAMVKAYDDGIRKLQETNEGIKAAERGSKQADEIVFILRARNFVRAREKTKSGGEFKTYVDFAAAELAYRGGRDAAADQRALEKVELAGKANIAGLKESVVEEGVTVPQTERLVDTELSPEARVIAAQEEEAPLTEAEAAQAQADAYAEAQADAKFRKRAEAKLAGEAQEDVGAAQFTAVTSQKREVKVVKRPVADPATFKLSLKPKAVAPEGRRSTVTGKISLKPKAAAAVAVAKKAEPAQQPPSVMRTPADEVASGRSDDVIILGPIELVLNPNQVTYFTTGEDGLAIKQDRQSFGRPGEIGLTALPDSRVPKALHEPIRAYVEGEITRDEFYKQIQELARTALEKKIEPPQPRAAAGRPLQRANYQPVAPTGPTVRMAGVDITPIQTTDVARSLRLTSDALYAIFRDGPARLFATFFKDRMTKRVGNIPVYIVTYEDMARMYSTVNENGERVVASGLYHKGKIALRADVLADPVRGLELAMHEALHAWSEDAINSDPNLQKALDRLVDVAVARLFPNEQKPYGLTDRYELISEAFSNPQFREFLASIELPNNIRAEVEQLLGPVKGPMRSIWDTFIQMIRAKMGLGDTLANYTMLDAVMRAGTRIDTIVERRGVIGDRAMVQRPAAAPRASLSAQELINGSADRKKAFNSFVKETWVKIIPLSAIPQQYADTVIGPALRSVTDAVLSTSPRIRQIKAQGDALATRAGDLSNKYGEQFRSLAQIMEEARMMDVSIEGQNFFEKNPKTEATKYWQSKARLGDLRARFSVLPPELKQLYRDMAKFYRDSHNDIVKASVTSILEELQLRQARGKAKGNALTEKQISELTQRVMDQDMTPADEALLGKTIYTSLENAAAFHRITGDYFPLMRYGDHVVTTVDKIKDTMGGKLEAPDTVLFRNKSNTKARDAAENFVAKSELKDLSVKKVYFDNATNTELENEDEAKSYNDVDIGYRVVMQTKGVYFFESRTEAERFVRTNPEGHDVINNPEMRMGSGYQQQVMSGTQVEALNKAIDGRVASKDITSGQGELIKSIVNQAAIRMLGGNRIASRRLKAQKVTGASQDVPRNLMQYNAAAAAHMAVAESAPVIRSGLSEMSDALNGYSGADRPQLVAVVEEVKARIDQGIVDPNAPGKIMKDVMTYAFLARLFSPAYTILQGMQVSMVTIPTLGSRFGNMVASAEVGRAYGDIGLGDLALQGMLNTARAAKQTFKASLLNTDDIVGSIRKKVSAASDGADVLRMMDEAIRLGAIDGNAGLEITNAAAEGRGKYGQTLAGVDRIARQLPQMMEAVNRSVSGIAAYRLARKKGQTHEQATQFAVDIIRNTQGDYSAANSPRFFNNPILRPALMFKKYALMMTYLLGDMVYRSFKGATPEEKSMARKQIANILAVQILVAGAFSLPGLEIFKVAFLLASFFGLGSGWEDFENELREILDASVGKTLGEMISSGLLSRAFGNGVDLSQRMSLADMWLFGEPKGDSSESMQAYMFRQAVGAPGGYLLDVRDAAVLASEGEFAKAFGKFIPVKFIADFTKAAYGYSEAKYEVPEKRAVSGAGELAFNALGFRTGRQAELNRERGIAIRERQDKQKEFKKLQTQYFKARTKGDMAKAIAKNREWNASLSKGEFRMKLPVKPRELRVPQ
jgi:hypothetical protein